MISRLKKVQKSDKELAKYYRQKALEARAKVDDGSAASIEAIKNENAALKEENAFLQDQNETLQASLQDALVDKEIAEDNLDEAQERLAKVDDPEYDFKTGGNNGRHYSDEFRNCVWELQGMHVGNQHIPDVINSVLKLVGKRMKNKPAPNTIADLSTSRLSASQQQLGVRM